MGRSKQIHTKGAAIILLVLGTCAVSFAQTADTVSKWRFLVEPYLLLPGMSGDIGLRNLPAAEIDASTGDLFGNLQFAFMTFLEAKTDRYAITGDLLYMNLSQEVQESRLRFPRGLLPSSSRPVAENGRGCFHPDGGRCNRNSDSSNHSRIRRGTDTPHRRVEGNRLPGDGNCRQSNQTYTDSYTQDHRPENATPMAGSPR